MITKIPKMVEEQQNKLMELLEQDDCLCLPVKEVAKILGMDADCLRTAAENGTCPFAIGGRKGLRNNRFTTIPKLALYNWITQGAIYK